MSFNTWKAESTFQSAQRRQRTGRAVVMTADGKLVCELEERYADFVAAGPRMYAALKQLQEALRGATTDGATVVELDPDVLSCIVSTALDGINPPG